MAVRSETEKPRSFHRFNLLAYQQGEHRADSDEKQTLQSLAGVDAKTPP